MRRTRPNVGVTESRSVCTVVLVARRAPSGHSADPTIDGSCPPNPVEVAHTKSCESCLSHVSPPRSAGPRVARTGHAHSPGTPLPRARHPTAFHIRRQRHLGCCRAPQSTSHLFKHTTVPTPHRPVQNCIIVTFSLASLMLMLTSLGLDGLSSGGGGGGGLVLPSTPAASAPGTRQERTQPLASAVQRSFS